MLQECCIEVTSEFFALSSFALTLSLSLFPSILVAFLVIRVDAVEQRVQFSFCDIVAIPSPALIQPASSRGTPKLPGGSGVVRRLRARVWCAEFQTNFGDRPRIRQMSDHAQRHNS